MNISTSPLEITVVLLMVAGCRCRWRRPVDPWRHAARARTGRGPGVVGTGAGCAGRR